MHIPFEQLPDDSRIWIFQSDKELTEKNIESITPLLMYFINDWTAHQQTLKASFTFMHNYFIVISVDENMTAASGCSIDKVYHIIRACGQLIGCDFFNRLRIAAMENNSISTYSVNQIVEKAESNLHDKSTLVFNNIIETKGELTTNWLVPIEKSWLASKLKTGNKV
ncbi:MAG TPA: hypothetical protein PKC85_06110 [Bacteroidia bacterium]|jgi:hypothetical protein|nr:hypothetical protein [Bacteroidia bacterium]HMU19405.1 hypothetical protein [Bacteroidia bacterium]